MSSTSKKYVVVEFNTQFVEDGILAIYGPMSAAGAENFINEHDQKDQLCMEMHEMLINPMAEGGSNGS